MYSRMRQLYQILGHKAATYCVLYDSSGGRVVTGADDCLVKVWSARTGMLLATFRGHEGQVTDLAINPESTILASSDTTGAIRVWSLETGAQITTLRWHRAGTEIDTIEFSPSVEAGRRYIFSTGKDCTVKAFRWWVDDSDPDAVPHFGQDRDWTKYNASFDTLSSMEQRRKCRCKGECKCRVICADFSPGGVFYATGSTDSYLRVYMLDGRSPPRLVMENDAHDDDIDFVTFNHEGTKIMTGSSDGTARLWHHKGSWQLRDTVLTPVPGPAGQGKKEAVKYGTWTCDDAYVVCALGSDHSLNVWNTETYTIKHVLSRHEHDVIGVHSHPSDPAVVLTAATDGRALLWDITEGFCMKEFVITYTVDGSNQPLDVLDCRFSPDGRSFSVVDAWGHWSHFGLQDVARYRSLPVAQFFQNDTAAVIRDANHFVLDQDTQTAPHLIPLMLVNNDGTAFGADFQTRGTMEDRLCFTKVRLRPFLFIFGTISRISLPHATPRAPYDVLYLVSM